jgi:hypothetical protein
MASGPLSLIPVLGKEAGGAKVSVSILLIAALCYGTFYLGNNAGAADKVENAKRAEKVADIEVTLSRVTTILERMEEKQTEQGRDLSAVESRTHQMNGDLQVIAGKVEGLSKNRR